MSKLDTLLKLHEVGQELASAHDLDMLLRRIMEVTKEVVESEGSSILLLDEATNELFFKQVVGEKGDRLTHIRIPCNEQSVAGWCLLHREPALVDDVSQDPRHSKLADQAAEFVTRTLLAAPLVWEGKAIGVVEAVNKKNGKFSSEDLHYLTILANHAAAAIHNSSLMDELRNFFVNTTELIVSLLDNLQPELRGHVTRVARLAGLIGREMGITGKEYEQLLYGAYLHDIGKLQLEFPAMALTDTTHPVLGERMLKPIRMMRPVLPIVRHHHERWDGTGYPDGLSGEQIPFGARIIAVAEDFEEQKALVNSTQAFVEFFQQFLASFGTKYDPALLQPFKRALLEITGGTLTEDLIDPFVHTS